MKATQAMRRSRLLEGNNLQDLTYTVWEGQMSPGVICHKVSLSSNQEDLIQGTTQGLGARRQVPDPVLFPRALFQVQVIWLPMTSLVSLLPNLTDQPDCLKQGAAGLSSGAVGGVPLGIRTPDSSQTANTQRQPGGTTETSVPGSLLPSC